MPLRKRSLRFFLVFIVTFSIALAAWGAIGSTYGAVFRGAGDALAFGSGHWMVNYSRQLGADSNYDTQLLLRNRQDGLQRDVDLSSRRIAYMPTAFLIALVLATPVPWIRKRVALIWGFVGVHLYIALRLAFIPATYLAKPGEESKETFLATLNWVLSGSYAGWTIVPLVLWLIVTMKFGLPLRSPKSPQPAGADDPT